MATRLPSLDGTLRTFAHRGASAHAPENTMEAFELALKLGAGGIESDVWLTADRVAVLNHDGRAGPKLRRRKIADTPRSQLPEHITSLPELYDRLGTSVPLSLDVKDLAAFQPVVDAARQAGDDAEEQLWLCSPHIEALTGWRPNTTSHLVNSISLRSLKQKPEQWAAKLRSLGIDALNLRHSEWTGGLVTLLHRFDRYALGWGAVHERELAQLIDAGIDGVYSDYVDRMTAVATQFYPS